MKERYIMYLSLLITAILCYVAVVNNLGLAKYSNKLHVQSVLSDIVNFLSNSVSPGKVVFEIFIVFIYVLGLYLVLYKILTLIFKK